MAASPRPHNHLTIFNPNLGENGCSTAGGSGLFSMGGDWCFHYGAIKNVTEDFSTEESHYEQFLTAIATGDYTTAVPTRKAMWVMKDPKRKFGIDNLDWEKTPSSALPSPRTKKQKVEKADADINRSKVSSAKASSSPSCPGLGISYSFPSRIKAALQETSTASSAVKNASKINNDITMSDPTSSSSSTKSVVKKAHEVLRIKDDVTMSDSLSEDDNEDGMSISSSEACMRRALNGETFEDEYADPELSATSSSGTSSDESCGQGSKAVDNKSEKNRTSSTFRALRSLSSPFDALRSSPATNMVSEYMSSLSPPDESVNLTRSYAVPVGPSKKKPIMKFTPISQINGVNISNFVNALQDDDPTSGEKIELDDDAASSQGQYIEMDLSLGVLEEKKNQDIVLRSDSSDTSSEESLEGEEDVGAINRLTHIGTKGKDVKGKKAGIQEL